MLLDDFITLLIANFSPALIEGNVFANHMPDDVDNCIAIFQNGGSGGNSSIRILNWQIMIRLTTSSYDSISGLESIRSSIITDSGHLQIGLKMCMVELISEPAFIKVDDQGRNYCAFNIKVTSTT